MSEDRRKYNGGNKNAGRKPKADEIALIETMDAVAAPISAWQALWGRIEKGDTRAIECWLNYRYGKPIQRTDHTTNGKDINLPAILWGDEEI